VNYLTKTKDTNFLVIGRDDG